MIWDFLNEVWISNVGDNAHSHLGLQARATRRKTAYSSRSAPLVSVNINTDAMVTSAAKAI